MKDSFQHSIFDKIRNFLCETQGSTAVEYATLLGLIAATLLPIVQILGQNVKTINQNVADVMLTGPPSEVPTIPQIGQSPEPSPAAMPPMEVQNPTLIELPKPVVDEPSFQ